MPIAVPKQGTQLDSWRAKLVLPVYWVRDVCPPTSHIPTPSIGTAFISSSVGPLAGSGLDSGFGTL